LPLWYLQTLHLFRCTTIVICIHVLQESGFP
jgi:hypothetical protein